MKSNLYRREPARLLKVSKNNFDATGYYSPLPSPSGAQMVYIKAFLQNGLKQMIVRTVTTERRIFSTGGPQLPFIMDCELPKLYAFPTEQYKLIIFAVLNRRQGVLVPFPARFVLFADSFPKLDLHWRPLPFWNSNPLQWAQPHCTWILRVKTVCAYYKGE